MTELEYTAICSHADRSETIKDGESCVFHNAHLQCGDNPEGVKDPYSPVSHIAVAFKENVPAPMLTPGKSYRITIEEVTD